MDAFRYQPSKSPCLLTAMDTYKYQPLSDSEFRLIQFEKTRTDGIVRFRIHHASLTSPPDYVALSYTWGKPFDELPDEWSDPTATYVVFADGAPLSVQLNLEAALERFQTELSSTDLFLWVDAICINQKDVAERNYQVTLMCDIYGKCLRTLVWLGPGVNDSDHGLAILRELYRAWKRRPVPLQDQPTPLSSQPVETISLYRQHMQKEANILNSEDDIALPSPFTSEGLYHLLNRNWWRRAWVLQEVLLSRQTLVYCGSSAPMDWNIMVAASKIAASIEESSYVFAHESFPDLWARIICEKIIRTFPSDLSIPFVRLDTRDSIRNMISLLQSKDATDPRDKVYAGLGLLLGPQELEVDYDIPVPELYTRVAKLCIQREGNLNVLSLCALQQDPTLPSWVPDLSKGLGKNPDPLAQNSGLTYATASNLVFEPQFSDTRLIVRGRLISAVSCVKLFPDSRDKFIKVEETGVLLDWLSEWLLSFLSSGQLPPLVTAIYYDDDFKYRLTNEPIRDAYLTTLSGGHIPPKRGLANPEFRRIVARMLDRRSLFAFENGLIGIGPPKAQLCDQLWAVAGSNVPLLLRLREDGTWNLVGECYAHGVMNGIDRDTWSMLEADAPREGDDLVELSIL